MQNDRISKLIGELVRLAAEYSAEEFEISAKMIKQAMNVNQMEKLALDLADIKRKKIKSQRVPPARELSQKTLTAESRKLREQHLSEEFSLLLKKVTSNKKLFGTTMSVRIFLKELFGHEIGITKDGRDRIIKKAIKEYNGLSDYDKLRIYKRLQLLSSPVSRDFEGYSRIIRKEYK